MNEDGTEEPQPTPPPEPIVFQTEGPSEEDIANAKRILREVTFDSVGSGVLPDLDHGGGLGDEDYGFDLERSTTVSDSQPMELPPLSAPPDDAGGGDEPHMWEVTVTNSETGTLSVEAGVVYEYLFESEGEGDNEGAHIGYSPIYFAGDLDAPSGEYLYVRIPVSNVGVPYGTSVSLYTYRVDGVITIIGSGTPPEDMEKDPDAILVPLARVLNRPVEDEDPPEEDISITQYLVGSFTLHRETLSDNDDWTHPFRLIRVDATTWRIETEGSSIINDDDGSSLVIPDLGDDRTDNGYVYIQCEITTGPVPSGDTSIEVTNTPKDEIEVVGGVQTYANLLIGRVYVNLAGDDLDISQAWNNAAILSMMFESGALRWAFQAHPSHFTSLTAGT